MEVEIYTIKGILELTCVPSILCTQTGSRWWCQRSSGLSPPPDEPGHQSWRRSCSVQYGTGWGRALELESKKNNNKKIKTTLIPVSKNGSSLTTSQIQNDEYKIVPYHSFTGLFPIHKSFRDCIWCQNLIPVNKNRNMNEIPIVQKKEVKHNLF